ncbi:hypothetical protein A9G11_00605 [Gilliamella sp. wkB108]|uniref:hypothetical protein n=1 Tax=Gilliamella sp. wkB108 TaxID=3120256 RepID=UPI00080E993A|nr:hypothetical protein [Gilliamella apicola]OCG26405.1 hypothetical protein A9G11_00605 [Gilliamella apicola]
MILTPSNLVNNDGLFHLRLYVENKHYWIKSVDVVHLQGESGQLNTKIDYWDNFPLSLGNLPEATEKDTVYFPRTLSIDSLSHDYSTIAIDENNAIWVFVTAGNKQGSPIKGWVNTATDAQEHIKRVTPWHWSGFNTIEDKASVGEVSKKLAAILDVGDCTETMLALLRIFKQSSINILPPEQFPEGTKNDIEILSLLLQNKLRHPFSIEQYKDALRTSWTAEQIGHLLLKYESEWYADDALSKWNEIDNLFEDEKQQKKKALEEDLQKAGIIKPHERNYALEKMEESHEIVKSNWQIEKEQRIKPSLWWKKVAELQAQEAQTTNDNQTNSTNTPQLTNLSTDGKAWFIHPVAMVNCLFAEEIDIIVFYIYWDGRIQKYIPSFIKDENKNKYRYVIVDAQGAKHKICDLEFFKIKEKVKKTFIPNETKYYFTTNESGDIASDVNDGDTKYRIIYANGDIAEWGLHSGYSGNNKNKPNSWRVVSSTNNEVDLLRMPDSINEQYGNFHIEYSFHNSQRRYANPSLFAAMLGSLAVYSKSVITTGSAFQWGSCFPSALHINGMAIDFEYRSRSSPGVYCPHSSQQYQDDSEFLNAMLLFFDKVRVGQDAHFAEFRQRSRVVNGGTLHDSHFHADFSLSKIEEIKE